MKPEIDPKKQYYLDLEIAHHDAVKKGKGIGSYDPSVPRWVLSQVYFEEDVLPFEMSLMVTVGYAEIPDEIPNKELFRKANEIALKDKDFENKVGLVVETMEEMINQLFGGTQGYFDAMILAGYVPFDNFKPLSSFPNANQVFRGPEEWKGRVDVGDLAVHFDKEAEEITSIWKAYSPAHRLRFFLDGLISLVVHSRGMPPVSMVSGFFPDMNPPLLEKGDV